MEIYKKGDSRYKFTMEPMCLDDMLPVDMFKLYAYSYFNGIRSSWKIEKECHRNIELMWLLNGLKPDFKTITDFRKNMYHQRSYGLASDELDE